jgi:hypothetical protein
MNAPGDLVQVEVEINSRLLKVLKALAELQGSPLGELIESLAHAAIAGTPAFKGDFLTHSRTFCNAYGYDPVIHSARAGREGASS